MQETTYQKVMNGTYKKPPPIFTCSTTRCKNKTWRKIKVESIPKLLRPKGSKGNKYLFYCEDHKIVHEQEYKGYRFVLEAKECCGEHLQNYLYEPDNPEPIRQGEIDLSFTAIRLMDTWTRGVDALIKLKEES